MLVIFPFEEDFYRQHNVPVTYVGHPLLDELIAAPASLPAGRSTLHIALMPGSRRHEIAALLPAMLDAVSILKREREVNAFIIQAPTIAAAQLLAIMQRDSEYVRIVPHDRGEALSGADVALSSSGTATLESAIVGTPVVVM